MEVDDQALARFMEACHCGAAEEQFFLEACGGSHERALAMFLGACVQAAVGWGAAAAC
jgi:hypothetical protein